MAQIEAECRPACTWSSTYPTCLSLCLARPPNPTPLLSVPPCPSLFLSLFSCLLFRFLSSSLCVPSPSIHTRALNLRYATCSVKPEARTSSELSSMMLSATIARLNLQHHTSMRRAAVTRCLEYELDLDHAPGRCASMRQSSSPSPIRLCVFDEQPTAGTVADRRVYDCRRATYSMDGAVLGAPPRAVHDAPLQHIPGRIVDGEGGHRTRRGKRKRVEKKPLPGTPTAARAKRDGCGCCAPCHEPRSAQDFDRLRVRQ